MISTRGFQITLLAVAWIVGPFPSSTGADPAQTDRDDSDLRFWLENMVWNHQYTFRELESATGLSRPVLEQRLGEWNIRPGHSPDRNQDGRLFVAPYPGGRHPRIGFLDGAVDPHRDTKASVFLPWPDSGYVVLDFPEAIWSNLGLTYLAHTHIPTIWSESDTTLERIEWTRLENGILKSRRTLPNGIRFQTRIAPHRDRVDLEMTLFNGTAARLTGLRTQICVLLKGAPDFNEQTNDNKHLEGDAALTRANGRDDRWVGIVWKRARPWANPPCPCMHSDPVFPDLDPGVASTLRGRLFVHEGKDPGAAIRVHSRAIGNRD